MPAYKDKNRGTWYAKFNFKDWQGKTRQKIKRGFAKKSDALDFEHEFKAQYSQLPSITLQTLATAFLQDYRVNHRANSLRLAERNTRRHILPYFASTPVDKITPLMIRKWQTQIRGLDLSESTKSGIQTTFKTLMRFAVKFYNLPRSPFESADKLGNIETRPVFITLEEWKKVDDSITDLHDKAFYNLLFWTGIRLSECRGLQPADFDFGQCEINITKQLNGKTLTPPKTKGSVRVVSCPKSVMQLAKQYLDSYIEVPAMPFALYSPEWLNIRFKKYCQRVGLSGVTIHALRHSHASLLIKQNIPITVISKRLGHSSPTMTLRIYSHAYSDDLQSVGEILENLK